MTLAFLRHSSISGPDCESASQSSQNRSAKKKLSKGKLSLLLSGNLIVWVIFTVLILDIDVFSMNEIPIQIPQKLSISGIVYNEKNPSAIISNKVYSIGDLVSGYTIIRITRTEVEFEKNGKKLIRQVK